MPARRLFAALAALLASALFALPTLAEEEWDILPIEVGPWGVLASDGSQVSSVCLGSDANPACIVETELACVAWSRSVPHEDPHSHYILRHPFCESGAVAHVDWRYDPENPMESIDDVLPMLVDHRVRNPETIIYYRIYRMNIGEGMITKVPETMWRGGPIVIEGFEEEPPQPGDLLIAPQSWVCNSDTSLFHWGFPLPALVAPDIPRLKASENCRVMGASYALLLRENAPGRWKKLGYYYHDGPWREGSLFLRRVWWEDNPG